MTAVDTVFEEWFWLNNRNQAVKAADVSNVSELDYPEDRTFGVHYFGDIGRGIIANRPLEAGQVILRVPSTMMISMTNPELRSRLETQLSDPSILKDAFASIVLLLLHEKSKPDSFWRPYFDSLPEPSLPMLWEDHLFDDMKRTCPATYSRLKQQKKVFNEAYFQVFYPIMKSNPHLFDTSVITLQEYRWAIWVVLSRAFELEDPAFAVIPMADMFNHQCNHEGADDNTIKFHTDSGWFVITATEAVNQGAQCYFSYGRSHNEDFFLCYGFLLPFNRFHFVPWTLDEAFFNTVAFLSMKQDVLRANNIPIKSEYMLDLGDRTIQFLYALSIYMMDKEDFDELDRADLSRERLFVSHAHRHRVVLYLSATLDSLEARHTLSVKEYEAKISSTNSYSSRLVVDYQKQELMFVHRLRDYIQAIIGGNHNQERRITNSSRGGV